nr:hypothetical protein [uncultured Dyadobacter sp.]
MANGFGSETAAKIGASNARRIIPFDAPYELAEAAHEMALWLREFSGHRSVVSI